jgi:TetR/AcrR family transcriptional repressor of nem operon
MIDIIVVIAIIKVKRFLNRDGWIMKISKEKAAENRRALVEAAGRLFRERGIDGVGVAEISKAAGLTHGALYAHFDSKDALAAAALGATLDRATPHLCTLGEANKPGLADFLDYYLSTVQRDNMGKGCALSAAASEIGRQDVAVSREFMRGFEQMSRAVERTLGPDIAPENRRSRALAVVGAMIGAVSVARGVAKADPQLSDEILAAARKLLGEIGGCDPAA